MSEPFSFCLHKVSKRFGEVNALTDISLTLGSGDMLALLGHNGAGKTTLMKIILGLLRVDAGDVTVLGGAPGQAQGAIGYVPENVSFYPSLTGAETLHYFARLNGLSRRDARRLSDELLTTIGLDQQARNRAVKTYSKGMKQRLGLAQAMLPSRQAQGELNLPQLLILDEPTIGLDPMATAEFYDLLANAQARGCGIVICTHVLPGLERYIDQTVILNQGRIIAQGDMSQLHYQANLPVRVSTRGLNGSLHQDPMLREFLQPDGRLFVPMAQKISVLERLMANGSLTDIDVQNPTLPELYQHYIQQTQEPDHGA